MSNTANFKDGYITITENINYLKSLLIKGSKDHPQIEIINQIMALNKELKKYLN